MYNGLSSFSKIVVIKSYFIITLFYLTNKPLNYIFSNNKYIFYDDNFIVTTY